MLTWEQTAWTSAPVDGLSPRYLPAVAFDPVRRVLVLFGGGATTGMSLYGDTWEFDGTTWRRVP